MSRCYCRFNLRWCCTIALPHDFIVVWLSLMSYGVALTCHPLSCYPLSHTSILKILRQIIAALIEPTQNESSPSFTSRALATSDDKIIVSLAWSYAPFAATARKASPRYYQLGSLRAGVSQFEPELESHDALTNVFKSHSTVGPASKMSHINHTSCETFTFINLGAGRVLSCTSPITVAWSFFAQ